MEFKYIEHESLEKQGVYMDTRKTMDVNQTIVITQKLMEIGGELESTGK